MEDIYIDELQDVYEYEFGIDNISEVESHTIFFKYFGSSEYVKLAQSDYQIVNDKFRLSAPLINKTNQSKCTHTFEFSWSSNDGDDNIDIVVGSGGIEVGLQ